MVDDHRHWLGARGEQIAAEHLTRVGLRVLERNFRTRFGELDIVAAGPGVIVFCEVKTRLAYGRAPDPLESIHPRKRRQVRRIAAQWLEQRPAHPRVRALRFDAVGVVIRPDGTLVALEHLEAAF